MDGLAFILATAVVLAVVAAQVICNAFGWVDTSVVP